MGQTLREWLDEYADGALLADGFDEAIIGVGERCGEEPVVVYDAARCVQVLVERDGMSPDEAQEFFEFNTLGAAPGDRAPIFVWKQPLGGSQNEE